jgi:hypothetical protein
MWIQTGSIGGSGEKSTLGARHHSEDLATPHAFPSPVFGNGYEVQKEEKVSCAHIYLNRGDHYDIKFQAKGCSSR